jgi:iron(III) transport system substrate-binding protein
VVYSPHGKEILSEFKSLFEKEHPGTKVDFLYIASQQCLERVRNEKQNPAADIWWGAGHTTFMTAASEGLLDPYRPTWADKIPVGEHDPADCWYASFLSPEIIFYNRDVIDPKEAPSDWEDLANPRWADKIMLRFPIPSDTMRAIFFGRISESIEKTGSENKAFEWMLALDANTKEYLSGGEQVFRKMAQRVGGLSVWTLSDIMLQKNQYQYPFEVVFPKSGCPVILDGISVVKGCPHPKAARAYYEFVTSASSAIRLAGSPYYRLPTRQDLPKEKLPEWMRALDYKAQPLDWNLYLAKMNGWMKRWEEEIKGQGTRKR